MQAKHLPKGTPYIAVRDSHVENYAVIGVLKDRIALSEILDVVTVSRGSMLDHLLQRNDIHNCDELYWIVFGGHSNYNSDLCGWNLFIKKYDYESLP